MANSSGKSDTEFRKWFFSTDAGKKIYSSGKVNLDVVPRDVRKSEQFIRLLGAGKLLPIEEGGGGGHEGGGEGGSGFDTGASGRNDYVERQMEALRKYAPETSKIMFQQYEKYAPKYAQVQKNTIDSLYPGSSRLRDTLTSKTQEAIEAGPTALPAGVADQVRRAIREAQSDRGFLNAPESGRAEAETLTRLGMENYNQATSTALNLDAGIPKAQVPNQIPGAAGPQVNDYYTALLGDATARYGIDTGAAFNYASLEQNQSQFDQSLAFQQQQLKQQRRKPNFLGGILGSIGTGIGAGLGGGLGGLIGGLFGGGSSSIGGGASGGY